MSQVANTFDDFDGSVSPDIDDFGSVARKMVVTMHKQYIAKAVLLQLVFELILYQCWLKWRNFATLEDCNTERPADSRH